jgi:hypothetical protein
VLPIEAGCSRAIQRPGWACTTFECQPDNGRWLGFQVGSSAAAARANADRLVSSGKLSINALNVREFPKREFVNSMYYVSEAWGAGHCSGMLVAFGIWRERIALRFDVTSDKLASIALYCPYIDT